MNLQKLLTEITDARPALSCSYQQAIERGHGKYLKLDYSLKHKGYKLVYVTIYDGYHIPAFNDEYLKTNDMYFFLTGIITAITKL